MKKIPTFLIVLLIAGNVFADLTATEGLAIDLSSAGAGTDFTIAFDPTELLGSLTWGDASTDTIVWTWNRATGTDPTITFNSGSIGFQAITLTTDLAVADGGTGASTLNDLITLTTHTAGNYVATLADSGNSIFTVANGSAEGGAATLDLTANGVDDTHIDWGTGAAQVAAADVPMAIISGATFSTVQHMQNIFHSAGWVSGGGITDDADGTITVAAGTGLIRATNSATAEILFTDWASEAGANVNLADNDISWVYVEYNAGSPRVIATITERTDFNTNILLANIQREGTALHINATTIQAIGDHANNMIRRLRQVSPYGHVSGGILSEKGTRNIDITAGSFWQGLTSFSTSAVDTSAAGTFSYYYNNGTWQKVATQTAIHQTNYNNFGVGLATLSNNKYGVHWVYVEADDDDIAVVYGIGDYTLAEARDAQAPSSVPEHLEMEGILAGKIIIKKSAAAFTQTESAFQVTFSGSLATDHGSLAGLADDDHTIYLLADGTRALAGAWNMGSQALTNVNIDSGVITGITDLAVADGGTGASALTNLIALTTHTTGNYSTGNAEGGDALVSIEVEVTDTTDATSFVGLFESATGDLPAKTDGGLTYNATTANLSTTTFTGALTGAASGNVLNSESDVMVGTLTADGFTLGQDENITLGSQTLDHDGTDFVFNDSVNLGANALITTVNIKSTPRHLIFNLFNPLGVQTEDTQVCIWPVTPAALTVTKIVVTLNAAGNEVLGDLKYADTFIGLANPVVINVFDTTSGVLSDDTITSASVAAGKAIYIQFDSAPHTDITQMCVDITFDFD